MNDGKGDLRRGWTTGACAAAAAKAACTALVTGKFPDPVSITLPGGQIPSFCLARHDLDADKAMAGIVKDAGDDPDVTHGALIMATVRRGVAGDPIVFKAGPGVGTVTRAGLPVAPGEPAINPVPRRMIAEAIESVTGTTTGYEVEIAVPGGEEIARKTLNGRLGIVGGISILGTTGIVIPYSCAAWIHSIHRGIDVARAAGYDHVAAATGSTSEKAVQCHHGLDEVQLIDMGDFAGGTLKYLRAHPVAKVTIAGGVAKMTKLAQGMLDLHSSRGPADMAVLADLAEECGGSATVVKAIAGANTVGGAFELATAADIPLGDAIAQRAWKTASAVVADAGIATEILVFDRNGVCVGQQPFA